MPVDYANFYNDDDADDPNRDTVENGARAEQIAAHKAGWAEAGQVLTGLLVTSPPAHIPDRAAYLRGMARRLRKAAREADTVVARLNVIAECENAAGERDAQEQEAALPVVGGRWIDGVLADSPRKLTPAEVDTYVEVERTAARERAARAGALRECPRCGEDDRDRLVWDRLGGETVTCQNCRKTFVPTAGPSA